MAWAFPWADGVGQYAQAAASGKRACRPATTGSNVASD
jgi:hypothetical protein